MKILDARGISCPEPLLMLKNALKTEAEVELLADSKNAHDNCREYAEKQGFTVDTKTDGGVYKMFIKNKRR